MANIPQQKLSFQHHISDAVPSLPTVADIADLSCRALVSPIVINALIRLGSFDEHTLLVGRNKVNVCCGTRRRCEGIQKRGKCFIRSSVTPLSHKMKAAVCKYALEGGPS